MQHIEPINFEPPEPQAPLTKKRVPLTKISLIFFLILLTIIAWFVFSAKSIRINVEPEQANITVNTPFKLILADRILLRQNKHTIEITAEGYYPLIDTLQVSKEPSQEFSYALKPLPGHLQIDLGEVTTAKITLDDTERGSAPTTLNSIEAGTHSLLIEAERYFSHKQEIEIEGRDVTQALTLTLTPAWAAIDFASSPDGAEIIINEMTIANTPATLELLEGKHEIRIKKSGFKAWQKTINVIASEAMAFTDINLKPADATLIILSTPLGASVTVNGNYRGQTPLELAVTPGKTASVHLRKQGYKVKKSTTKVQSGETKQLNLTMSPELVEVKFNIQPADATVYINGQLAKLTENTLSLPTTKQIIDVRKKGYVDHRTNLTPHSGAAQRVNVKLKTLQQQKIENIKPVITSTAGQELKLFYPYAFTMGASRREPGRRANETIQDVKLERPFYLSLHEVSNEQFHLFKSGHSSGTIQSYSLNTAKQPVTNISWDDAALYCNWLSKKESLQPFYQASGGRITGFNAAADGYRLPSEAEWAWAARTVNNKELLKLPWGGATLPPSKQSGNYADSSTADFLGKTINNYNDGFAVSAPIGSFPANHKGLFDMGGNASEWVHDYYSARSSITEILTDPLGPTQGEFHVIRGASWAHGTITELRLSYRDYTDKPRDDIGFRIARYLE